MMDWYMRISAWCERWGLSREDAEDCVWDTLALYQRKRGVFPWEATAPDWTLLRSCARDVAVEHARASLRRSALMQQFMQRTIQDVPTSDPEDIAIEQVDVGIFITSLPTYLREFLHLRLYGYTLAETAQAMGIALGTAKRYSYEIRERFIEFSQPHTTFSPCDVGINSGSSHELSELSERSSEVNRNAETMDTLGFHTDDSSDPDNSNNPDPESNGGGRYPKQDVGVVMSVVTVVEIVLAEHRTRPLKTSR